MSATMAEQGGRVQLEQSDMRLALNMAKMAKGGFSRAAPGETQVLIKRPCAEVRQEKTRGVDSPRHKMVRSAMERHPAMVYGNHTAGCLPCQNGTDKNPQTCWRRKGTAAPAPEPAAPPPKRPPLHGTPPPPPGDTDGHGSYEIEAMLSKFVYLYSPHPNTEFFNHNDMPRIASAINILFQICWVQYLLRGNTADIDFRDDDSLLSESEGEDDHWLKGTGFLSIISIYN